MIENITSPKDIKEMSLKDLRALCGEIRETITDTVSKNGGHLASNLGMVETTVAIHKVFDVPRDALIFDVGHQAYAHKLLTGRYGEFSTLRKTGGISGFVNAAESEYDIFTEGHSGTAISQALGVSAATELKGDGRYVIAVVGDGSFTNGMVYEALNNCKTLSRRLIIILNDNEMSISKNVGGMSGHLTRIRTSRKYFSAKRYIKGFFSKIPGLGKHLTSGARRFRDFIKKVFLSYNIFEALGADYIGVADGNDLGKMINVLLEAKTKDMCTVVHIHTQKGKGYAPAERDPAAFHSTGPFSVETGLPAAAKKETFSSVFGETLCSLAEKCPEVCAVTAAMEAGTGLSDFAKKFPERRFDVGIAEEHAVTFAAGLCRGGLRPVAVLYSTFSQRTFDQVFHDMAIQHIPATICIDRAGVVEGDGVSHQGIFDVSLFSAIPNVNIYSPDSFEELRQMLTRAVFSDTLDIIRYPKGAECEYDRSLFDDRGDFCVCDTGEGADVAVITYGRPSGAVLSAAFAAAKGSPSGVRVIKLKKIAPLPEGLIEVLSGMRGALFIEEGTRRGGVGEYLCGELAQKAAIPYKIHAIDGFIEHGSLPDLLGKLGFTESYIEKEIASFIGEL